MLCGWQFFVYFANAYSMIVQLDLPIGCHYLW